MLKPRLVPSGTPPPPPQDPHLKATRLDPDSATVVAVVFRCQASSVVQAVDKAIVVLVLAPLDSVSKAAHPTVVVPPL